MTLSISAPPKTTQELTKRIAELRGVEFKVIEPITRQSTHSLKKEVDQFAGNKAVSVVLIKQR